MAGYLPTRDADLDGFAATFDSKVSATPTAFGLTAAQATAFTALFGAWHSAYVVTLDRSTRTQVATENKNAAKEAMINGPGGIRALVNIIQAFPGTTNAQRIELGITVPDVDPSPVPPPAFAPEIDVFPPVLRTVKIRLHNEKTIGRKGKPAGAMGATIFSYVGELPPPLDQIQMWKFEMNTGTPVADIEFPSTVDAGATVWITANWYNRRGETSPATPPVYTKIPGTLQMAA